MASATSECSAALQSETEIVGEPQPPKLDQENRKMDKESEKRPCPSKGQKKGSSSKVQRLNDNGQSTDHPRSRAESGRTRKTKFKAATLNEEELFDEMVIHAEKELTKEAERLQDEEVGVDDLSRDDDDTESLSDLPPAILKDIMLASGKRDEFDVETLTRANGEILDWDLYLENPENVAKLPSVNDFKKVPLAEDWERIAVKGVGVEIENPFYDGEEEVYWIGTVLEFAGYKAKVEMETFDENRKGPCTWVNFCNMEVKHLGWCKENQMTLDHGSISLLKGLDSEELKSKLDQFSLKPSIKPNHLEIIRDLSTKCRTFVPFKIPLLEAIDLNCFHQNKVCRAVDERGDRVALRYVDSSAQVDLWLSYHSERLHVFGWSHSVGVQLNGIDPPRIRRLPFSKSEFPSYPEGIRIEADMQFETRHPKRVSRIVGAVVKRVLKYGYFILKTRDEDPKDQTYYLYHITSPLIFPVGFGKSHGIKVEFQGYSKRKPNLELQCLPPRPQHKFRVGMKFEAVSIVDCEFISPATIIKVADHMLLMKYDSFQHTDEFPTFWVDSEIGDIYPIGYCEMIGLEFTGTVDLTK